MPVGRPLQRQQLLGSVANLRTNRRGLGGSGAGDRVFRWLGAIGPPLDVHPARRSQTMQRAGTWEQRKAIDAKESSSLPRLRGTHSDAIRTSGDVDTAKGRVPIAHVAHRLSRASRERRAPQILELADFGHSVFN